MLKVILIGDKNPQEWEHTSLMSAMSHAISLANFHHAKICIDNKNTLTVDATEYYKHPPGAPKYCNGFGLVWDDE